ncbi:hypothetical protein ABK040_008193 [Willaertia magna]
MNITNNQSSESQPSNVILSSEQQQLEVPTNINEGKQEEKTSAASEANIVVNDLHQPQTATSTNSSPSSDRAFKTVETQEWQSNFKSFPIVDTSRVGKKQVAKFYQKQNELIDQYANLFSTTINKEFLDESDKEEDDNNTGTPKESTEGHSPRYNQTLIEGTIDNQFTLERKKARYEYLCIHLSFWANILLFLLKLSASILSLSLSVITSAIDSALDLLSGLILFITSIIKRKRNDIYKYPQGKDRLEPLGFIIFATCTATASLQVIKEGVVQIVTGLFTGEPYSAENDLNIIQLLSHLDLYKYELMEWMFGIKIPAFCKIIFYLIGIGVLLFTIIVKVLLFILCRQAKDSPSVSAYSFDHRNDIITNSFLVFSLFISQWLWWFDAFGAIILSIYIIYSWIMESVEHVTKLVGKTADPEFIKRLTFIAINHNKKIKKIETVTAWYSGSNVIAEIHIVLDGQMTLQEAHNIGEDLQLKIESQPDVERCYVHLDFNSEHSLRNERFRVCN